MVGTAAQSAKLRSVEGTGTSIFALQGSEAQLRWAVHTPGAARVWQYVTSVVVDQTAYLAIARDCYLAAIERQIGAKVATNIGCVETDEGTICRLTLKLPASFVADTKKVVDFEMAIHERVVQLAPAFAGFFSLQYEIEDGQT